MKDSRLRIDADRQSLLNQSRDRDVRPMYARSSRCRREVQDDALNILELQQRTLIRRLYSLDPEDCIHLKCICILDDEWNVENPGRPRLTCGGYLDYDRLCDHLSRNRRPQYLGRLLDRFCGVESPPGT